MDSKQTGIRVATWLLPLALAACATSSSVGEGRYLLVSVGGKVVAEIDTGNGGMASCANQVAMTGNRNPQVTMHCAAEPAKEPLAFSYRAHQQVRESDGYKPSSPYWVRADTRARCATMRDATRRGDKTVILEDRCT